MTQHNRTGFYLVHLANRRFDVAVLNNRVLLASAHDGNEIPWESLASGQGQWSNASPFGPAPTAPPRKTLNPKPDELNEAADEALEICDEIDSLMDDVPSRAEDFALSVADKVADIRATVVERKHATAGQIAALENMRDGLARWVNR